MSGYHPRNILVTGGAGFIGSNFIRYCLQGDRNVRVINLDLMTYSGSLENLQGIGESKNYVFIRGDICDAPLVDSVFRDYGIDTVVHFAAESHVDRSIDGPAIFIETNFVGTFTLLEIACKFWETSFKSSDEFKFHHISTDEVYGSINLGEPCFTEESPYAPNSPYSATKAGSDLLVRAYNRTYGLPVTITNSSNNYGPYQHQEKFIP